MAVSLRTVATLVAPLIAILLGYGWYKSRKRQYKSSPPTGVPDDNDVFVEPLCESDMLEPVHGGINSNEDRAIEKSVESKADAVATTTVVSVAETDLQNVVLTGHSVVSCEHAIDPLSQTSYTVDNGNSIDTVNQDPPMHDDMPDLIPNDSSTELVDESTFEGVSTESEIAYTTGCDPDDVLENVATENNKSAFEQSNEQSLPEVTEVWSEQEANVGFLTTPSTSSIMLSASSSLTQFMSASELTPEQSSSSLDTTEVDESNDTLKNITDISAIPFNETSNLEISEIKPVATEPLMQRTLPLAESSSTITGQENEVSTAECRVADKLDDSDLGNGFLKAEDYSDGDVAFLEDQNSKNAVQLKMSEDTSQSLAEAATNGSDIQADPVLDLYQFLIPSDYCGKLIGVKGRTVNMIKNESGVEIELSGNASMPYGSNFQLCSLRGTPDAIKLALSLINDKMPKRKFPALDLTQVNQTIEESSLPTNTTISPESMQLTLPGGVSLDVVVSAIVSGGHVFVQQPTHPTFPMLERLNQFMTTCYLDSQVPQLPRPIEVGVICAVPAHNDWFRGQVVGISEEECDIRYLDYGGYSKVNASTLKQIRSDFMTLPFQATECYMANITHREGEDSFSDEAAIVLDELTRERMLQLQVIHHHEDGTPFVNVFQPQGTSALFVNREMVNKGVVRWIEMQLQN